MRRRGWIDEVTRLMVWMSTGMMMVQSSRGGRKSRSMLPTLTHSISPFHTALYLASTPVKHSTVMPDITLYSTTSRHSIIPPFDLFSLHHSVNLHHNTYKYTYTTSASFQSFTTLCYGVQSPSLPTYRSPLYLIFDKHS